MLPSAISYPYSMRAYYFCRVSWRPHVSWTTCLSCVQESMGSIARNGRTYSESVIHQLVIRDVDDTRKTGRIPVTPPGRGLEACPRDNRDYSTRLFRLIMNSRHPKLLIAFHLVLQLEVIQQVAAGLEVNSQTPTLRWVLHLRRSSALRMSE